MDFDLTTSFASFLIARFIIKSDASEELSALIIFPPSLSNSQVKFFMFSKRLSKAFSLIFLASDLKSSKFSKFFNALSLFSLNLVAVLSMARR